MNYSFDRRCDDICFDDVIKYIDYVIENFEECDLVNIKVMGWENPSIEDIRFLKDKVVDKYDKDDEFFFLTVYYPQFMISSVKIFDKENFMYFCRHIKSKAIIEYDSL